MKEAKFIRRGFAPCFFAISAALVLNAVIWGAAISFALSYVIAPWQSHILMLFNSVVCSFIPVSLLRAERLPSKLFCADGGWRGCLQFSRCRLQSQYQTLLQPLSVFRMLSYQSPYALTLRQVGSFFKEKVKNISSFNGRKL